MVYRQGARVVLVGRPNVGKSSLLNRLLRANRAIVTHIPGTTRDTLEETANLGGVPVVLVDTAGITESANPIERLGIERSHDALAIADLALLVFDMHAPLTPEDSEIAALTFEKPTLLVWNKVDLSQTTALPSLPFLHPCIVAQVVSSTRTDDGMDTLVEAMVQALTGSVAQSGAHLVTNPRHRDALSRAADSLRAAVESHMQGVPTDLLAGDLTITLHALGEITGETVTEDLLNTIFSRFCIGK